VVRVRTQDLAMIKRARSSTSPPAPGSTRKRIVHARAAHGCCLAIACLAIALSGGCSERKSDGAPGADSSAVSVTASASAALIDSARGEPTSASAAAASSKSPTADTGSLSGTWEGEYHAKKGSVEMPSKVKDATRVADDGKASTGAGTVSLTISPDGEIRGTAKGALGDATLRGQADASAVRASVSPDNPSAPSAMTGVLVGMVKDGTIQAQLRVSGPDATVVREADFELKRK
jgi:hypothetical protein